jgi:DNA polymerase-3 subunit alpha
MDNYIPLNLKSHFSLLSGLSKPKQIVKRLQELEISGAGITDIGNISGTVQYIKAMEEASLKPILGLTLGICEGHSHVKNKDNAKRTYLPLLAKNTAGWQSLIKITSLSNHPDSFYTKPRLSFDEIQPQLNNNFISFSGRELSHIGSSILQADGKISPNWKTDASNMAYFLRDLFGRENFYLEVQLVENSVEQKLLAECVRELAKITGIPCVATPDPYYPTKQDSEDHKILLCRNYNKTLYDFNKSKESPFARTNNFHIPNKEEMAAIYKEREIKTTFEILDKIEKYNILKPPTLPHFSCPNGLNEQQYLRELCINGWNELVKNKVGGREKEYGDRLKKELGVFEEENLSGYFLIVKDICDYMASKGWQRGVGRGSAAGCLLSYMINLTSVDSIKYDLLFERFFNNARRGSMPDFDLDVPVLKRDAIIEYIKDKYGRNKVSQIAAFQTIKGRGAIKTVLGAHNKLTFEEMNRVTKYIPEESKISDELQIMKDSGIEPSILRWCLENRANKFEEWCVLKDDDTLEGPLAYEFSQAMRLEGTKIAQSKHAAGIVIAPEPIDDLCPMYYEKKNGNDILIAGLEKDDVESIGLIKLDILGIAALDKLQTISNILRFGDDEEEVYDEELAFTEESDE